MDFAETDEQRAIRAVVREFGRKEIEPHAAEWDLRETFPKEMNARLAALGLLGGTMPATYGGAELDYVTFTTIMEELAYFSTMVATICGQPSCSLGRGMLLYGSEDQKQRYLRPSLEGRLVGATAVTEPHSGTDVLRKMETTARRDGDHYVLNGSKAWVSNIHNADWFLTFATLDRSLGYKGVCAFAVDRTLPGTSTQQYWNKASSRSQVTGELSLHDVRVPAANRIGAEGAGYKVLMAGTEIGRLACAARAVGQLRACLDHSVKYAQVRTVFDAPIGRHQLIQQKIAQMSISLEAARLLTYRLAWLSDRGETRLQKEAAAAKVFATDALMQAATEAVQIHGAYGISGDLEISRIWRDAKTLQIYDGTNEILTVQIAEHELGYRQRG